MEPEERIVIEPLFVGCTRPAMIGGVTYTAAAINFMFTLIFFLAVGHILALLVAVPVHFICAAICRYEPRQFELLKVKMTKTGTNPTRRFWSAASFAPLPLKLAGRQDNGED